MTADLRELLQEGVDGFSRVLVATSDHERVYDWVKRCRAALAEQAPEPVAWLMYDESKRIPLVCHLEPSNRHLVGAFPVYRSPPPASPEWATRLEKQAANVIAWSCRLEAEQGPQAKCLEWCRDKRRCTASFASPPASPDDAADAARYLEALTKIASYREGPVVNSSFDEPESAKIARAAIEREGGAK